MNRDERILEDILISSDVDVRRCMRCGKCTATCPAFDGMEYHPHEFVYMVERGKIRELMASPSIFKCLSCFACLERCPRQVEPARLVEEVRLAVIREQGGNYMKPEQIPALLDGDLPQQAVTAALRKYRK